MGGVFPDACGFSALGGLLLDDCFVVSCSDVGAVLFADSKALRTACSVALSAVVKSAVN